MHQLAVCLSSGYSWAAAIYYVCVYVILVSIAEARKCSPLYRLRALFASLVRTMPPERY